MALNVGMLGDRRRQGAVPALAPEGYGAAALALMALWAVMIWPWLTGRVTIPWDAKAHFQPQIQFLAQSLARGEMPFWSPFVFAGHPQIADPQSMIFSAPFLLLALASANPSSWAVDMTVLGSALAGGLARMLWFRGRRATWGDDRLRLKGLVAVEEAAGPLVVHGVHTTFHPPVELSDWPDADHRTRIVLILRDVDPAAVVASFHETVNQPLPTP